MKIIVRSPEIKFPITVPVPYRFLKSKLIWHFIKKYAGLDGADLKAAEEFARQAVVELDRYIKRKGHFVLVSVDSSDGHKIEIVA